MIAKKVRIIDVSRDVMCSETGYAAPEGWRIVNTEWASREGSYRVTIVTS